jgi:hypothetical protein
LQFSCEFSATGAGGFKNGGQSGIMPFTSFAGGRDVALPTVRAIGICEAE